METQLNYNERDENPEGTVSPGAPPVRQPSFLSEVFKFLLIAVFIVLPFRIFVAQPFIVNGASMVPTFDSGEYLIVDQISYRFGDPSRGDVIIFKYPRDPSKFFIKRVIGLPGETVAIDGTEVVITNSEYPKGLTLREPYVALTRSDNMTVRLGKHEYFVMGDNRSGSSDSRSWGPLEEELIIGRPVIRLLPINRASLFPGVYSLQ